VVDEADLASVGMGDDRVRRAQVAEPVGAEVHRQRAARGGGRLEGTAQHQGQPGGSDEHSPDQGRNKQTVGVHDSSSLRKS
jgi:hypothetical protein